MAKGGKTYCEKCNDVVDSSEYARHMERHSGATCDVCPIDTAIQKLIGVFKRR